MTTSLLDVRIDDGPTLREIAVDFLPDGALKQLEVWEKTQNRMIRESQRLKLLELDRNLRSLGNGFEVTGNDKVARRLALIANELSGLFTN
jgi:hypothetical protein